MPSAGQSRPTPSYAQGETDLDHPNPHITSVTNSQNSALPTLPLPAAFAEIHLYWFLDLQIPFPAIKQTQDFGIRRKQVKNDFKHSGLTKVDF